VTSPNPNGAAAAVFDAQRAIDRASRRVARAVGDIGAEYGVLEETLDVVQAQLAATARERDEARELLATGTAELEQARSAIAELEEQLGEKDEAMAAQAARLAELEGAQIADAAGETDQGDDVAAEPPTA
jgi:chromosome segregation ATPase